jgi:hypothetical protein
VVPAHYQVPFSRLGHYKRSRLDDVVYKRGEFTEQWAHEASIVPVETWPLLRHRMAVHRVRPYGFEKFLEQNPEYVQLVLDEVRTRGPLTADELPPPDGDHRHPPGVWHRSVPRAVVGERTGHLSYSTWAGGPTGAQNPFLEAPGNFGAEVTLLMFHAGPSGPNRYDGPETACASPITPAEA